MPSLTPILLSCQVHNFTEEFYAPPVVMVTANHLYDSKNVYSIKPENNVLNTWIEVRCRCHNIQGPSQLTGTSSLHEVNICSCEPTYDTVTIKVHEEFHASTEFEPMTRIGMLVMGH